MNAYQLNMTAIHIDIPVPGLDSYHIRVVPELVSYECGYPDLRQDLTIRIYSDNDDKPRLTLIEDEANRITCGLLKALHLANILDDDTRELMLSVLGK